MKATQVGVGNREDQMLNWFGYIQVKYDGLFPSNFPTRGEMQQLSSDIQQAQINHDRERVQELVARRRKRQRLVKSVQREWMRQQ